jgi:hypothetical protein
MGNEEGKNPTIAQADDDSPIVRVEGSLMSESYLAAVAANDYIQRKYRGGETKFLDDILGAEGVIGVARDLQPNYTVEPDQIPFLYIASDKKTRKEKEIDIRESHVRLIKQGRAGPNLYISEVTYWVVQPKGAWSMQ